MESQSKVISVKLSDGTNIKVEATLISDTQNVTPSAYRKIISQTLPFNEVTAEIESLSKDIAQTLQKLKPDKASVKFGVEIGVESGKLTAVLAKGTQNANLEITLEWNE